MIESNISYQDLVEASMEELRLKTQAHVEGWRMGVAKRWDLNQDKGELVFSFSDGVRATCPAQIIGTFVAPKRSWWPWSNKNKEGSWLWSWANPSISDHLRRDALKVQEYGAKNKIKQLTEPTWPGEELDAWAMAALATKLCDAQGAYRGPEGNTFVFMTFGEVTLSK